MTETVGNAVGDFPTITGPQRNQIAVDKKQIKVKDFQTLIIQAVGRPTSTWLPKRSE